jgi:hypothetical protein
MAPSDSVPSSLPSLQPLIPAPTLSAREVVVMLWEKMAPTYRNEDVFKQLVQWADLSERESLSA